MVKLYPKQSCPNRSVNFYACTNLDANNDIKHVYIKDQEKSITRN